LKIRAKEIPQTFCPRDFLNNPINFKYLLKT
jgi:hypothetical protein